VFYDGTAPNHNPNVSGWGIGIPYDPPKPDYSPAYQELMKKAQVNY
jgi:hypothetical protein